MGHFHEDIVKLKKKVKSWEKTCQSLITCDIHGIRPLRFALLSLVYSFAKCISYGQ